MYLSMLAQMEDKYPPQVVREAEHRRAFARSRRSRRGRGPLALARVAPHFRRARAAANAEPC